MQRWQFIFELYLTFDIDVILNFYAIVKDRKSLNLYMASGRSLTQPQSKARSGISLNSKISVCRARIPISCLLPPTLSPDSLNFTFSAYPFAEPFDLCNRSRSRTFVRKYC